MNEASCIYEGSEEDIDLSCLSYQYKRREIYCVSTKLTRIREPNVIYYNVQDKLSLPGVIKKVLHPPY